MPDNVAAFLPIPVWTDAALILQGLRISVAELPGVWLVSGDLSAFGAQSAVDAEGLGALGQAKAPGYALRLARGRLMVIGAAPPAATGWHAAGFAVSEVSAAYRAFDIEGADLPVLLARATTLDPDHPGPCAALPFGGVPVALCRFGAGLRLHVEAPLAPALWHWLAAAMAPDLAP